MPRQQPGVQSRANGTSQRTLTLAGLSRTAELCCCGVAIGLSRLQLACELHVLGRSRVRVRGLGLGLDLQGSSRSARA